MLSPARPDTRCLQTVSIAGVASGLRDPLCEAVRLPACQAGEAVWTRTRTAALQKENCTNQGCMRHSRAWRGEECRDSPGPSFHFLFFGVSPQMAKLVPSVCRVFSGFLLLSCLSRVSAQGAEEENCPARLAGGLALVPVSQGVRDRAWGRCPAACGEDLWRCRQQVVLQGCSAAPLRHRHNSSGGPEELQLENPLSAEHVQQEELRHRTAHLPRGVVYESSRPDQEVALPPHNLLV